MNKFEQQLIVLLGKENLEKIQNTRVGIAGSGGLGSNCAFNLVRSGFKKLVLVDFDRLDYSNLNRQFYFYGQVGRLKVQLLQENLMKINPDLEIRSVNDKLTVDKLSGIFNDCQVIVEALDNVAGKKMLVEHFLNDSRLLVTASGLAGWGNSDQIISRKINENSFLVGDLQNEASVDCPPISPRVNIAAAKQADIVLDYVLNINE